MPDKMPPLRVALYVGDVIAKESREEWIWASALDKIVWHEQEKKRAATNTPRESNGAVALLREERE